MVHENVDRAHVPGHQPVPERDIEPLWPSEAEDPAQPWAGPVPATAWAPAPAAPGATHGNEAGRARGAEPPADAQEPIPPEARPAEPVPSGPVVPTSPGGQPGARVDLDQPFTLDQAVTT
ncbi:MAG: chromosome partitioning protein, partial [Micromonospora sp.]